MSTPQLIHHTDYRSKAENRKRELKKLQEKGLAKTEAARLRDAPVPTEACNFLEKQRELFAARRKNQADAMLFLHQFRADDDFVLRAARRSLGSIKKKFSEASKLGPGRQPDARASVYSYAVYPTLNQTVQVIEVKHNGTLNEPLSLQSTMKPPDIIEESISYKSAFEALELAAKEASRQPLPEDDDIDEDNEYLETAAEDERTQLSLSETGENNSYGHNDSHDIIAAENENGKCNSILILQGEVDDSNVPSRSSDHSVTEYSSAAPFIPYEAFSKLGASLVLESLSITQPKSFSDDDSLIPGESFLQLGASMMANDLCSSSKDDSIEKTVEAKESERYSIENPDLMSTTATEITASQLSSVGSKSLSTDTGVSEGTKDETLDGEGDESFKNACDPVSSKNMAVIKDESVFFESEFIEQKKSSNIPRKIDVESNSKSSKSGESCCNNTEKQAGESYIETGDTVDDTVSGSIMTPKKSNVNGANLGNDDSNCANQERIDEEDKPQESKIQSKVNTEVANTHSEGSAPPRNLRRSGRKKKKKKDQFYYPSSSLFVSRQFLSR